MYDSQRILSLIVSLLDLKAKASFHQGADDSTSFQHMIAK